MPIDQSFERFPPRNSFDKFKILEKINAYSIENLKIVFHNYLDLCKQNGRVIGNPMWREGINQINVIGIRSNPEISFNLPGETYYNDLLLIIDYGIIPNVYFFSVTMDPRGKSKNIAHLLEGIYASYTALRPHKYIMGRTALVQDRDAVLVARTDAQGNVISAKPERGWFGINVHDSGGYQNSSLGCTVLEPDSIENNFQFANIFKPILLGCSNKAEIDYCVINFDTFKSLSFSTFQKQKVNLIQLSKLAHPQPLMEIPRKIVS